MPLTLVANILIFLFLCILPYFTLLAFFGGLIYRIILWFRTPKPKAALGLFPKPRVVALDMTLDETVFPRMAPSNKVLWVSALILHASLVFLFVGHVRLFFEPTLIWTIMGFNDSQIELFAFLGGGTVGILFTIGLLILLARRGTKIMRKITVLEDLVLLGFLITIAITGNLMRFAMHMNVAELQTYFSSLVFLRPTLTPAVLEPIFVIHYLIVMAFLIYFPHSKLIHVIGSIFSNIAVKV